MFNRSILIFTIIVGLLSGAVAHEFWLQPADFFPKIGNDVSVLIRVGENFEGERWGGGSRRAEQLKISNLSGEKDLLPTLTQADSAVFSPNLKIEQNGTQMLTLATNSSFIELKPDKFLAYLKEDGLENAIAFREKNDETSKNGRELYRRCAKTLLQVSSTTDATPTRSSGLILDIIPQKNPYSLTKNQSLTCQFLYESKPLAGTLVRCWRRAEGKTEIEFTRTDSKGNATFALVKKRTGIYMVSTVRMVRLESNPRADWQSTWGSMTFAIVGL